MEESFVAGFADYIAQNGKKFKEAQVIFYDPATKQLLPFDVPWQVITL